eukprot:54793-Amorphochlora_amoeboformis.AAC.4
MLVNRGLAAAGETSTTYNPIPVPSTRTPVLALPLDDSLRPVDSPTKKRTGFRYRKNPGSTHVLLSLPEILSRTETLRLSKQEEKEAEERRRQRAERRRELYFKNKNDGQPFKWPVRVLWLGQLTPTLPRPPVQPHSKLPSDGSTESGDLTLDFQRKTLTFGHMILPLENMNKLAQPSTKKGSKDLVTLSFQNYPTFLIRFEAGDRPCNRCYKLLLGALC